MAVIILLRNDVTLRQRAVQHGFRRGALRTGVKFYQQHIVLRRDALKADPVCVQMMLDGKTIRHAGSLAHRTDSQRRLLML